jgi:hypothetical protein
LQHERGCGQGQPPAGERQADGLVAAAAARCAAAAATAAGGPGPVYPAFAGLPVWRVGVLPGAGQVVDVEMLVTGQLTAFCGPDVGQWGLGDNGAGRAVAIAPSARPAL